MELRRVLKDLLVTAVRVRGEAVLFEFHAETPVRTDTLLALAQEGERSRAAFPRLPPQLSSDRT